jgi:heptosyltransferase-2
LNSGHTNNEKCFHGFKCKEIGSELEKGGGERKSAGVIRKYPCFYLFLASFTLDSLKRRILIVRTDRVGDVVMITPMIRELRKKYPDAYIATLTQSNTANILLNNPYLDEIIIDDLTKESFFKVVKELRRMKFTEGLMVFPTIRATYQMLFGGIKTRIGEGHRLYEVITGMRSVDRHNYAPLKHEADYCMDLARKIGVKTDNIDLEIYVTDDERKEAYEFLKRVGVGKDDLKFILHTGNLGSSPNWSEDKYLQLIKEILALHIPGNKILLTAVEMSEQFIKDATALDNNIVVDISNEIMGLREFIKIISVIDLFVCNSTGPLHLADALNRKCIGINCHRLMNSVQYWGIINKNSINIEVSEEYCEKNCSHDKKICAFENGISVDQVINGIKTLIN